MPLTPGDILQNRYRIVALLGQGGMGAVYRAWDLRLEVPVALKEQLPQPGLDSGMLANLRQQFRQEAITLARLSHPNLVRVTDFFEERGNAYLVMELLQGESLADRIARVGSLPEAQVLTWARQLLDALAYCHGQGIIHRDIKPSNILLRADGQVVLVDFGLVKLWNPADPRTQTALRGMGTPEYAPPEQYGKLGQTTDPRSDIYSLGATLYHALTGQAPPTASDRTADPSLLKPVRVWNPQVSSATEMAVTRALAPVRDDRWTTAAEMALALSAIGNTSRQSPVAASEQKPVSRTATMPHVQPGLQATGGSHIPAWSWALGAVVVLILLLVGLGLLNSVLRRLPGTTMPTSVTSTPGATATSTAISTPSATPATSTPSATPVGEGWITVELGESLYAVCRRYCPQNWGPETLDDTLQQYHEKVAVLNNLPWNDTLRGYIVSPGDLLAMPPCPTQNAAVNP